jgi:hypothetical protein
MKINQRSKVNWTPYLATGVAEGFEQPDSEIEIVEAWAYLIKTGLAYQLQGWFGRNAEAIIQGGSIDRNGNINWAVVDEHLTAGIED